MKTERGAIVVEVLFVVPALMLVVLLIVRAGHITSTSIDLHGVASVSARRASQASVGSMWRVAESTVRREVSSRRLPCARATLSISVNRATEDVQVIVRCQLKSDGLGLLGVSSHVVSATAASPIDRYRHQ